MADAPVLCVFGTASDVGKSWVATGLCRLFADDGVDVAPYKAQNLSNFAGVTPDGLEMGRAQLVQAAACRQVPHVDMNPLLLKPHRDGAQVVALGRAVDRVDAGSYFDGGMEGRRALVLDALDRLRSRHALIVAEGAGSCAEVNLRGRDLVNFPVAHHADAPVLLVADIDKGGVFAQLVGTLEVLAPYDRARVAGLVVNRLRGDARYFADGVRYLEARTGLPVLGVLPWCEVALEREDDLAPRVQLDPPAPDGPGLHVAALRLPHLSNPSDLDALERRGVAVHWLTRPRDLSGYDAVVVPGSKHTRHDLAWLRAMGLDRALAEYRGLILGLCGGYQLLGERIADPLGVEGPPGEDPGLGLLPVRTVMAADKTTRWTRGRLGAVPVEGYEIHVGRTEVDGDPLLTLDDGSPEGCRAGRVLGSYLHGLLDADGVIEALFAEVRPDWAFPEVESHAAWRERQIDRVADHLRSHLDVAAVRRLVGR